MCSQVPELGSEHGSAWPSLHLAHSEDWTCLRLDSKTEQTATVTHNQ